MPIKVMGAGSQGCYVIEKNWNLVKEVALAVHNESPSIPGWTILMTPRDLQAVSA